MSKRAFGQEIPKFGLTRSVENRLSSEGVEFCEEVKITKVSLRKRIANNKWLNNSLEAVVATWIRFTYTTSTWDRRGFEELEECLAQGVPVIIVAWHQRVMMAPYLFDVSHGPICALTSSSRAGRLAGNVVKRFGLGTLAISSHDRDIGTTREVLRLVRRGVSIGLAADGPRGPARVCKQAPLAWACALDKRVFVVGFSARRVHAVPTWDKMWLPSPWTRGVMLCREWQGQTSRFPSETEAEELRLSLEAALDNVTDESDRLTGQTHQTEALS